MSALRAIPLQPRAPIPTITVGRGRRVIRLSGICPYCKGTAFDVDWPSVDVDRPPPNYRGTVKCLLCSRDCAHLVIGGAA